MSNSSFSHEEIVREGKLSAEDMTEILKRRRDYNRLGYAYQLAFVRLASRFPAQQPLEIDRELLTYVGMQLSIPDEALERYQNRQQTMAEHRTAILAYHGYRRFGEAEQALLEAFLFEEAGRLEQTGPLLVRARQFLKEEAILFPAKDTLQRLIARQRQKAREYIYARVSAGLDGDFVVHLEALLVAGDNRLTPFQALKNPPGRASPAAMLRLAEKLTSIKKTGLLHVDLAWLNNNYQRSLARYAWRCSADRMRRLKTEHRHAALVCFLGQVYRDTLDYMIDMHHKLLLRISQRAQKEMDDQTRKQRRMIRSSLATLHTLSLVLLDENISDGELRRTLFERVDKEQLTLQMTEVATWLTGKYSHVFNLVVARFAYLRQFAPVFLKHLDFRLEEGVQSSVIEAIRLLREMNAENRRILSADAPLDFIPQKLRPLVEMDGTVNKRAWECALLSAVRDELKAGNLYVMQSTHFGRFDNFFIPDGAWDTHRETFFKRAGLPVKTEEVPTFLEKRLNRAFDDFLELLPENTYVNINENGWQLSVDPAEKLEAAGQQRLEDLKAWLVGQHAPHQAARATHRSGQ